jgi:hypothetical protein
MIKSYLGYSLREPNPEEILWFRKNPNITGYASDDGCIVTNPYTTLNKSELEAVCINEAIRLFMREHRIEPKIRLTQKQLNFFRGTAYEGNNSELKKTIISRIVSGDPSAQDFTAHQKRVANEIHKLAQQNENI